jgi:hypothetical protein
VEHHYRGKDLEGLELDIWLAEYRLGIEYQGEQHYIAIDHWGGEEELKKRKANDRKKRALCKSLNYNLIEFTFREDISVDLILKKLGNYINS